MGLWEREHPPCGAGSWHIWTGSVSAESYTQVSEQQLLRADVFFMFEWDDAKAQNASVASARLQSRPLACCSVSCNDEFLQLKREICSLCSIVKHSWCKVGVSHSPLPLVGLEDHGGLCLPNICTSLRSIPGLSRCSAVRRGGEGHT